MAGPAALLVAKLHKLGERVGTPRIEPKDALDVLRLLRGTEAVALANRLVWLEGHPVAGAATLNALGYLDAVFVRPDSPGADLAARASAPMESADVIRASIGVLVRELVEALVHTRRGARS